jgi:hypothetical protein
MLKGVSLVVNADEQLCPLAEWIMADLPCPNCGSRERLVLSDTPVDPCVWCDSCGTVAATDEEVRDV